MKQPDSLTRASERISLRWDHGKIINQQLDMVQVQAELRLLSQELKSSVTILSRIGNSLAMLEQSLSEPEYQVYSQEET